MNYFQGNAKHPRHISVGAVVRNAEGLIRVHHFPADLPSGFWKGVGVSDFYILMRETLNPNETLESAVHRGLQEEFNCTATIDDYFGSITAHGTDGAELFQKTTLYFLCTYAGELPGERDMADEEGQSILEWKSAAELIPLMKAQREKFGRDDIDESAILEKLIRYTSDISPQP